MGLYNGRFDTKSFRDRYKLFQSRYKRFHVLGLKNKEHARNVLRVHAKTHIQVLEVTEISQGCAVSLKGSDRSLYGNDRIPYKERGPTERERLLKVIFNALDVNYCYFNDNCVPKQFDRLALSPSSSGIRPVISPPTKSPHRNT